MKVVVADRRLTSLDEIGLPTWASHQDALPSSPSSWDFEFEDAGEARKWIDADGATPVHDSNKTVPSCLYVPSGHAVYIGAPPLPFTVTAKLTANVDAIGTPCDTSLAVCSDTPATHDFRSMNLDIDNANKMTFGLAHWNSRASWAGTSILQECDGFAYQRPVYLRWVVRSATDMDAKFSFDGRIFSAHSTSYNPGYSSVPYVMLVSNGSRGVWDWVRFTRP